MNDMELGWLIPTMVQVVGVAIGLAVVGFAYERGRREGRTFASEITQGGLARWLSVGGVVFAAGLSFTQVEWWYRGAAMALGVVLVWLAWTSPAGGRVRPQRMEVQRGVRTPAWRWVARMVGGLMVLAVLGWGIHLSWHSVHLLGLAKSVQGRGMEMGAESGLALVSEAAGDVKAIYMDLRPLFPLLSALERVPKAGIYLGQVEPLLTFADGLAQAGNEIGMALGPVLSSTSIGEGGSSMPERLSRAVEEGRGNFEAAAEAVERANEARSRIEAGVLPEAIRPWYVRLDENFALLEAGVTMLMAAPKILGAEGAQSYLVLAQNRDELRATGGFISGIGLVTLEEGKIVEFSLGDSYSVDDFSKGYPQPPEALHRFMLADYWVPRDANWSPDFPTSARKVQELYTLSTGVETQGVIAFNQLAVRRVLEVTGAVQVPGTDEAVSAENVEAYIRQAWAPGAGGGMSEEWWLHRKDFMQQLGGAMIERVLKTSNQEQMMDLGIALLDLLEQGQVLVYFTDPAAQSALEKGAWDHTIEPGTSDYLYLVDSNVGFNKVDSVVERSIAYRVDLSDADRPTGEVTVTYTHTGSGEANCKQLISYGSGTYQDMVERCYLDYWRLFMPAGSGILGSEVQPVPGEQLLSGQDWAGNVEISQGEAGTQVFAGLLMLPTSQSSQIVVTYTLPQGILHHGGADLLEYSLVVDVQPGLEGLPFQFELKLPVNTTLREPGQAWKQLTDQEWTWQGVLDKSTTFIQSIQMAP
jgi:Protein of unknown function (DUF4012)